MQQFSSARPSDKPILSIYNPADDHAEITKEPLAPLIAEVSAEVSAGPKPKRQRRRKVKKPEKPWEGFPLFAHATKRWAKKIRGKTHYFGPWDDPEGAEKKYNEEKNDLHAGRVPRQQAQGFTLVKLVNRFLTAKKDRLERGKMTARSFGDFYESCELVLDALGKDRLVEDVRASDFELVRQKFPKNWGPWRESKMVQGIRSLFKYAYDQELIDKTIRFGDFKKPDKTEFRQHRHKQPKKMIEAAEIRKLLDAASPEVKAAILLGVNCGYGNTDIATLPLRLETIREGDDKTIGIDWKSGVIQYPRPKTGIERRCIMWKETAEALQVVIDSRPKPKDEAHAERIFITKYGNPWVTTTLEERKQKDGTTKTVVVNNDALAKEFTKLLKDAGLKKKGVSFYALRHVFETIAGETKDQVVVDRIMGHVDPSMAAGYREKIGDARLKAVADHVHAWLFGK
jgi:integrase